MNKNGYANLEIIVPLEDLPQLRYIQNKLRGSIKIRRRARCYRYRLQNKKGMTITINSINGNIQDSSRLQQLYLICQKLLSILVIEPVGLTRASDWYAGFLQITNNK